MEERVPISRANEKQFWAFTIDDIYREFATNAEGLLEEEIEERLKKFGPNTIVGDGVPTIFTIFFNQFKSPLIFVLVIAGAITIALGEYKDSVVIFAAVAANAILGFYQEHKAEEAVAKLKSYLKERIRVVRGKKEQEIETSRLVPGDVIRLSQGDRIPADARLTYVNELSVDEAILTGESLPEHKQIEPVAVHTELGDRTSMVFGGTLVMEGTGVAVICRTGGETEIGKIAKLVSDTKREETPLQHAIKLFTFKASIILVLLTLVVFAIGIRTGYSLFDMFLTAVAIAVSAVPEGLPIALTVVLAISVQRLSKRNGIVRKLLAAETLGSTSIILTDKTGTLTKAQMTLAGVHPAFAKASAGKPASLKAQRKELLEFALLNTDVIVENPEDASRNWRITGRPLEKALVLAAARESIFIQDVKEKNSILMMRPFNSRQKYSGVLVENKEKRLIVFLGAPDVLLDKSKGIYFDGRSRFDRNHLAAHIDEMAYRGERVLGVAVKIIGKKEQKLDDPKNLLFVGTISFRDPVRKEAKDAFKSIEAVGVRTVIVTGDHRGTAEAVGKELGMSITEEIVFEGADVRLMSDEKLQECVRTARIFARVSPEDKVRIVEAFRVNGEVVAMTGDGVNDAPSLRQADIGIAMGSGSDVTKDVADMVLLDDNFATITAAIEEGKRAFNSLRKIVVYLFSDALDELILIGGALLMGLALPISALQILWVNFFSDSFPAIALAFKDDVDSIPTHPVNIRKSFLDREVKFLIFVIGIVSSALLFLLYLFLLRVHADIDIVRTFMFAAFGSYTLFLVFAIRSLNKSIFHYNPFSNYPVLAGVSVGFIMLFGGIYFPPLQGLLDTVALPPLWLAGVIAYGFLNILGVELGKWLFRDKKNI